MTVNLTGNIKDASNKSVSQFTIENVTVPNNSSAKIEKMFNISSEMTSGQATVELNVYSGYYKERKIQVAETKWTSFTLTFSNNTISNATDPNTPPDNNQTTNQKIRDIAVIGANISTTRLYTGEPLKVNMVLENKGNETETFLVTVNYNEGKISNETVTLITQTQKSLNCTWDTTDIDSGTYVITVKAERLPGEVSFENNEFRAGTVTLDYPLAFPDSVNLFIILIAISAIFTVTLALFFLRRRKDTNQSKEPSHLSSLI
jgi:hypothetical protein